MNPVIKFVISKGRSICDSAVLLDYTDDLSLLEIVNVIVETDVCVQLFGTQRKFLQSKGEAKKEGN